MTDVAKPRILVVEDDPDLRRILKLQLASQGYEITEAENGAEGFQAIQAELPDCVILDLMMPVMDGFGFLKRVRSIMSTKDVPILILTASEDERNRVRGFQYQADAYMSKPYDLEKLTESVEKLHGRADRRLNQSDFPRGLRFRRSSCGPAPARTTGLSHRALICSGWTARYFSSRAPRFARSPAPTPQIHHRRQAGIRA